MFCKAILLSVLFAFSHNVQFAKADIDCSNTHLRSSLIGVASFRKYQSYMYNFGDEIKEAIAEDFFEGFKVIGQMGLYLTLYDSIGGGYLSNQGGVSHYLSYFKSLVTNIVKNTCEWLKSYGDTFSIRAVNCSDPSEVALLMSYIGSYNDIFTFFDVLDKNLCLTQVSTSEMEHFLNNTIPPGDINAKMEIKHKHDSYLANQS